MNRYKYISQKESGFSKRWKESFRLFDQFYRDYPYYHEILQTLESEEPKPVVIVKGRQIGLSTLARRFAIHQALDKKKNVLMTYPQTDTMRRGVKQLGDIISGCNLDVRPNRLERPIMLGEGRIVSASYLGDTRGYSADVCIKDECDIMDDSTYSGYQSTMSHGRPSMSLDYGTPILTGKGNVLVSLWSDSDQREFHSKCSSCGHLFRMTPDNCGSTLHCENCDGWPTKNSCSEGGVWIPSKPNARRIGYRMPAFLHPDVNNTTVAQYRQAWPENRFKIEFEGRFLHE